MPSAAPIRIGVIVMCMDASIGRCWQVAAVSRGGGAAAGFAAGWRAGPGRDDRGDVSCGEPQVFADEGARDKACGCSPAQPRLTYLQQFGRLLGRVHLEI